MVKPLINFIMIRTSRLIDIKDFYEGLGLELIEERHGNGPIHYSYEQDRLVIEIYPGAEGNLPGWKDAGSIMLGFYVEGINGVIEKLEQLKGKLISKPIETERGIRAVLEDPDGRRIELIESRRT